MPANAPIVLNDGHSDITFSPDSSSPTHVQLQNLAVPELNLRELVHFDRPSSMNGTLRRSARLNVPYSQTLPNGDSVLKMGTVKIETTTPPEATQEFRKRLRLLAIAILMSTATEACFDRPEWFW